jgi:hypothetical protein
MKDTIRKILKEDNGDDRLNGKSLEDEIGKSIDHNKSQIEHMWRENNIPLNQYNNVYYKVIRIDDYAEPAIYHLLLFVDDEQEGAIEIRGHSGSKKDTNELIWTVTDQGGYDNSFFGGGTPHFVGIHPEDLKSEGWILHPKKVTFPTSKYQNKVSHAMTQMHTSSVDLMNEFKKIALILTQKLEESNDKVIKLKNKLGVRDKSDEHEITRQVTSIKGKLNKMLEDESKNNGTTTE